MRAPTDAERKRRLHAEASRRYRRRLAWQRACVVVEYTGAHIDGLVRLKLLADKQVGDRKLIAGAIAKLLDTL
jgi:hypothetical protein